METIDIFPEFSTYRNSFMLYNEKILLEILKDNASTEFGIKHGFLNTGSAEEYRLKVPIAAYTDFENQIRRMRDVNSGTLCSYPIFSFLKTSGSTDIEKLIPISQRALQSYGNVMDRYLQEFSANAKGKRLWISFQLGDTGKKRDSGSALIFTDAYYHYLCEHNAIPFEQLSGGADFFFFPEICDFRYAKLWLAFACEDICSLESVYLYDLLIFFKYMEDHYSEVLDHMENHAIPEEIRLPRHLKEKLLAIDIKPDRLKHVRRECSKGFGDIARRLWKDIGLVSGIGSKAFKVGEISLKKYTGDIPVWHYIYAASECLIGVPADLNTYDYILYPGSAYYEFRPEDAPDGETVDVLSLKKGMKYELILTTFSGLYRYAMEDIIEVRGFYGELPVIRFCYRKNLSLNIAGEKMDMLTLDSAVGKWSEKSKLSVWQYFFYEDHSVTPSRYSAVLALSSGVPPSSLDSSELMDSLLEEMNSDYKDLKNLGSISKLNLKIVDRESFLSLRESHVKSGGQLKPKHIVKD